MLYKIEKLISIEYGTRGLNPCFVGKCSTRGSDSWCEIKKIDLILVLLENALQGKAAKYVIENPKFVLILVLLENALQAYNHVHNNRRKDVS